MRLLRTRVNKGKWKGPELEFITDSSLSALISGQEAEWRKLRLSKYMLQLYKRLGSSRAFIIVGLVVALTLVSYYLFQDAKTRSNMVFEAVTFLLQLIMVVLLGGILVQEYSRKRDKDKALNEFRKDLLSGMTRAYNDTKKIRRMLKASVVRHGEGNEKIPSAVYEAQLEKLMDPQLEFEFYKRQLEAVPAFKDTEEVTKQLKELEHYLNEIFKEYQDGRYRQLKGEHPCQVPVKGLQELDGFLTKGSFRKEFANKFRSVAKEIQKEILDL